MIRDQSLIRPGSRVICALSGGADSTALCLILASLREKLGISLFAAHVNHCIRGEESDADEGFVRAFCQKLGIELYCERIDVPSAAAQRGESLELCARELRYAFLSELARSPGAQYVATAHNADDNLETAILNLARGSGLRGLCGVPVRRECGDFTIIRPLLYTSRAEIEDYLASRGQDFVTDSTNLSDDYSRNHVRHNIVPQLKKLNPSVVRTFAVGSEVLSAQADYIGAQADAEYLRLCEGFCAPAEQLLALHPAIRGEVFLRMYRKASGDENAHMEFSHIEALDMLCASSAPSACLSLSSSVAARREYGRLYIEPRPEAEAPLSAIELPADGEAVFGGWRLQCVGADKGSVDYKRINKIFVDCSKICGKLFIRTRRPGDTIRLAGHAHSASLKKLMIDRKIPRRLRDSLPVIEDGAGIVAAALLGADERLKIDETTTQIIEIKTEMI